MSHVASARPRLVLAAAIGALLAVTGALALSGAASAQRLPGSRSGSPPRSASWSGASRPA
jgi:hypothetical protein